MQEQVRPNGDTPADRSVKVSVRGVTKRFGTVLAADHIDLDIYDGEFLTLLGSSGCGKTTLMRLIAGLETSDEGEVWISGRDVTALPPRQRELGMVFQQYSLFPHLTVFENIAYGLKVRKWSARDINKRVVDMLDLIRLPEIADRLPAALSGGQQQRVSLARALASEPSVLMLDEPLGALDLKLRRQLQTELKRIHRETGVTFIFVTHDQEEALHLSDRIAVMRNGRIEQIDHPQTIYDAPSNEFVADFVGDVTFLDCTAAGENATEAIYRSGDSQIRIETGSPLPSGGFRLAVRPEHVALRPSDHASAADQNSLPATIDDIMSDGGTALIHLTLPAGESLIARQVGDATRTLRYGTAVSLSISGPRKFFQERRGQERRGQERRGQERRGQE